MEAGVELGAARACAMVVVVAAAATEGKGPTGASETLFSNSSSKISSTFTQSVAVVGVPFTGVADEDEEDDEEEGVARGTVALVATTSVCSAVALAFVAAATALTGVAAAVVVAATVGKEEVEIAMGAAEIVCCVDEGKAAGVAETSTETTACEEGVATVAAGADVGAEDADCAGMCGSGGDAVGCVEDCVLREASGALSNGVGEVEDDEEVVAVSVEDGSDGAVGADAAVVTVLVVMVVEEEAEVAMVMAEEGVEIEAAVEGRSAGWWSGASSSHCKSSSSSFCCVEAASLLISSCRRRSSCCSSSTRNK